MKYLILLFLLSCGKPPAVPDLTQPEECRGLTYQGAWYTDVPGERLYLDKACWGTLNSCNYFFGYTPSLITGNTRIDMKVSDGPPRCIPKGKHICSINASPSTLWFKCGEWERVFRR